MLHSHHVLNNNVTFVFIFSTPCPGCLLVLFFSFTFFHRKGTESERIDKEFGQNHHYKRMYNVTWSEYLAKCDEYKQTKVPKTPMIPCMEKFVRASLNLPYTSGLTLGMTKSGRMFSVRDCNINLRCKECAL